MARREYASDCAHQAGRRPGIDCIWCLKASGRPVIEHIVGESLGCPEGWVLKHGEVCRRCNGGTLSVLDAVLAESFDFLRVWAGVPGKRGQQPSITGRTNLRGRRTRNGHVDLFLNTGTRLSQHAHYGLVGPAAGRPSDVTGGIRPEGSVAHVNMRFAIGTDPRFGRAVHKVAFESYVKLTSWKAGLDERFDAVRAYVLDDVGHREVLTLIPAEWSYEHRFAQIHVDEQDNPVIVFVLCGFEMFVDLGPGQIAGGRMKAALYDQLGEGGWSVFPVLALG